MPQQGGVCNVAASKGGQWQVPRQLLGPHPNAGDPTNDIKADKEDQKGSMKWAFPSFCVIQGKFFHKNMWKPSMYGIPGKYECSSGFRSTSLCIDLSFEKTFEMSMHTSLTCTLNSYRFAGDTHNQSLRVNSYPFTSKRIMSQPFLTLQLKFSYSPYLNYYFLPTPFLPPHILHFSLKASPNTTFSVRYFGHPHLEKNFPSL